MIKGIGVDVTSIKEIRKFIESDNLRTSFIDQTFTADERKVAAEKPKPEEYYATRFAAKEAVFKAVAHLLPEKNFDMRIVETLNDDDGRPYICINDRLSPILLKAGVDILHISIATEGDFATAFVIAWTDSNRV